MPKTDPGVAARIREVQRRSLEEADANVIVALVPVVLKLIQDAPLQHTGRAVDLSALLETAGITSEDIRRATDALGDEAVNWSAARTFFCGFLVGDPGFQEADKAWPDVPRSILQPRSTIA